MREAAFGFLLLLICAMPLWGPPLVSAVSLGWGRFRRRSDPAHVIFEAVERLLKDRPDDWKEDGYRLSLPGTPLSIWIANQDYGLTVSTEGPKAGSDGLKPSAYWRNRLWRIVKHRRDAITLATKLNTICDAVETLERSNVVQFRGRG